MTDLTLIIGDMNLSSWSLRPWFAMKQGGIPFKQIKVLLDRPGYRDELRRVSPSGRVPVLMDSDTEIWESLAILEYLNEKFPEKGLWPDDMLARAHARSIANEMHSGFENLRTVWPMMFARHDHLGHTTSGGVHRDIKRIVAIWSEALEKFGSRSDGPFLYGRFSIADAMYIPVVSRFATYGPVAMPNPVKDWCAMMLGTPAAREWAAGAKAELAPGA